MTVPPPGPPPHDPFLAGPPAPTDPWAASSTTASTTGPTTGPTTPWAGGSGAGAPPPPRRDRRLLWWGIGLGIGGLLIGVVAVVGVLALVLGPALGRELTSGGDRAAAPAPGASGDEQDYLDTLDDITYYNFSDEDLVAMARQLCAGLDDGQELLAVETGLSEDFGAGGGDTWDVAWSATHTLCQQHAALTDDTGPGDSSSGAAGADTLDTAWVRP